MSKLSLLLVACVVLSACGGVDPNSPLGQRKAIFKEMLKTSEDMSGMLHGRLTFEGQKFADNAVRLDALSHQPWKHFPAVREADHTSAKDDVWQKQARFQELARSLESATGEMLIASQGRPFQKSVLTPAIEKVEDACDACHREFRDH
jgi:cytochrome c556